MTNTVQFFFFQKKEVLNRLNETQPKREITHCLCDHWLHRERKKRERKEYNEFFFFAHRHVSVFASLCSSIHVHKKVCIKAQLNLEQIFNEITRLFFFFLIYMVQIGVTAFKLWLCFLFSLILLYFLLFISYMNLNISLSILCMKIIFKYTQWHFVDGIWILHTYTTYLFIAWTFLFYTIWK